MKKSPEFFTNRQPVAGDLTVLNKEYEDIFNLVEQITGLADRVFPYYEAFAEEVASDCITDINEIERGLDYILSYCFDNRILLLYKKILRKIYKQYPSVVKSYVDAYYDMYESDEGENEEFFTTNHTNDTNEVSDE